MERVTSVIAIEVGFCDHGNEPSSSKEKGNEILE